MVRTLREDLLEGGVKGRFYVLSIDPDTVYSPYMFFWEKQEKVVFYAEVYDPHGIKKKEESIMIGPGKLREDIIKRNLSKHLFDRRAPESFVPQQLETNSQSQPMLTTSPVEINGCRVDEEWNGVEVHTAHKRH